MNQPSLHLKKKNTVVKILGMFLINKVIRKANENLLNSMMNNNYNYDDILIQETSKNVFFPRHIKQRKKLMKFNINDESQQRNIELIFVCLLKFPGFIKYIKFNELNKEDIRKISCYIKHEFYRKGSYIFRMNDKADKFYGVIRGNVSMRENSFVDLTRKFALETVNANISRNDNKAQYSLYDSNDDSFSLENFMSSDGEIPIRKKAMNDNELNSFIDDLEKEKITANEGMCFGEWGIMYNIPRTASAYCTEDTDVFYLDKEYFDSVLGLKLFKADMKKLNFILSKFPILKSEYKFRHLLTKITPVFYDKDQIVYTQFDKAEILYLVYQGECGIANFSDAKSKEDIELLKNKAKILSKMTIGGIAGLECCKKDAYYDNTLIVASNFTVLLKINMKFICEKCKGFRDFLIPLYEEQKRINNDSEKKRAIDITKKKKETKTIVYKGFRPFEQKYLERTFSTVKERIKSAKESKILHARLPFKENNIVINSNRLYHYYNSSIVDNKRKMNINLLKHIRKGNNKQNKERKKYKILLSDSISPTKSNVFHRYINSASTDHRTVTSNSKTTNKNNKHNFSSVLSSTETNFYVDSEIMKYRKRSFYNTGKFNLPLMSEYK